ncbi:MAG: ATP-binding protein, partial [Gammaproteobacteria bacterium]
MADPRTVTFGSFRVDLRDERLWHGADAVRLTNKAFGVLQYLVEHPAQLVTKEALLESVWSRPYVSDAALAVCIRELRRALADDAKTPRFIETVRGRGYRFIAPIAPADSSSAFSHAHLPQRSVSTPRSAAQFLPADLVAPAGRESELAQLHGWLATALQGDRRVGFISGEAGIGKTTLVDAFVAQAQELADLWIGHGQCIDHYGAGEAYLPVLEALARLCRGVDGDDLVSLLRQHAPSWLLQMPALLSADELQTLQRTAAGTTRERMLRELAEAVEVLTARRPMLLVFEDLHWSDTSTLEWLAYVTRRRDPARLLVLVTYRPVEVIVHEHPLHTILQELRGHDQSAESVLDYLSQNAIAAYLAQQSVGMPAPEDLVRAIHERSSGNPLFVVALLDTLMSHGVVSVDAHGWRIAEELETVAATVPESLRQLIDGQLDQLDTEVLGLLEAASVAGAQFSAAAVAAGISGDTESIDAQLATLSRRGQFVRALGTIAWPDGTLAGHYGFIHAVYQEVLSSRVPVGRRSRLHRQIGARLETAYGVRAREIAAELAAHFVQGSDASRAARYLMFAGENAAQRSACQEAITHFNLALENLQALPDTPERAQRELPLQYGLGGALIAANGFAWPQTGQAFVRARELCAQLGNTAQVSTVLYGVCLFHLDRGEMTLAREIAEGALPAAEDDITVQLVGHRLVGTCQDFQGELVAARENLEVALGLYDATEHASLTSVYATDVRVATLCWLSRV